MSVITDSDNESVTGTADFQRWGSEIVAIKPNNILPSQQWAVCSYSGNWCEKLQAVDRMLWGWKFYILHQNWISLRKLFEYNLISPESCEVWHQQYYGPKVLTELSIEDLIFNYVHLRWNNQEKSSVPSRYHALLWEAQCALLGHHWQRALWGVMVNGHKYSSLVYS